MWHREIGPSQPRGSARARRLEARRPPLLPALAGSTESPVSERDLRGHVVRTQRFRFSEEPGLGTEGSNLEVCVPQVRAAAPSGKRLRSFAVAPWDRSGSQRTWWQGGSGIAACCLQLNDRGKGLV